MTPTEQFLSPICPAVFLWHVQKWLREKKGIDVLVQNCACGYLWEVSKAKNGTGLILFDDKGDDEDSGCWTTYEGALSAGLNAALNLFAGKEEAYIIEQTILHGCVSRDEDGTLWLYETYPNSLRKSYIAILSKSDFPSVKYGHDKEVEIIIRKKK